MKKIYFTCSGKEIASFRKFYPELKKSIVKKKCNLIRDWFTEESVWQFKNKTTEYKSDMSDIFEESLSAINEADRVIFSGDNTTMSVGYQLSIALNKKKPVLLLVRGKNINKARLYVYGSNNPLLEIKTYSNIETLTERIESFLEKDFAKKKVRMNFFLEEELHDKIEQQAKETGKTKTDIIKEALKK